MNFFQFREALFRQSIFSVKNIRLMFPGFNPDNLLYWQKNGYIKKLRNGWYCFTEFLTTPDFHYLVANSIYSPSYISHQQALMFYGIIPEHIVDSVSITTKKTNMFIVNDRKYKYYSVKKEFFFGYRFMEINLHGIKRNILMADREKAILDLLYIYDFYRTGEDMGELRLNETVLQKEVNWTRMSDYLCRFNIKVLEKKVELIKKIYGL